MSSLAARMMRNPVFSRVYERAWRPVFTRLFSLGGTATEEYDRALRAYLARPGERLVLDVACGPGNYTRRIADGLTGSGRCVGIDFSPSMLATAARTNAGGRAAYVRADAHTIPFPDNTFDTVVCLAALYLIPEPLPVIDEMARVTRPGGEVVVFTSADNRLSELPGVHSVVGLGGYRIFGTHEITDRFRAAGLDHVEQTVIDLGQYVIGIKP
ncbi:class I SAM-dependent methyltransferase [Gordonia sinesedis]